MFPEQSLAKLRERFHLDQSTGTSEPDLRSSPVNSHLSLSRQTLDAGSQTSISGDVSYPRERLAPALAMMGLNYNMDGKWDGCSLGGLNSNCVGSIFHIQRSVLKIRALSFLSGCHTYQDLSV